MNNYDYPLGSDTPSAPWNQPEPTIISIDATISQTFHKDVTLDVEEDEDSDYNLDRAFDEQQWSIEEILNAIPEVYESLKKECCKEVVEKYLKRLGYIAEACKGWTLDESEVIRD